MEKMTSKGLKIYRNWMKKTEEFIVPEYLEAWEKSIWDEYKENSDFEDYMDVSIKIMEKLDNGATTDEIKEVLDNSGIDRTSKEFRRQANLILTTAKKGPEFCEQTLNEETLSLYKKHIEDIKQRNEKLNSTIEERNRLKEEKNRLEEHYSECIEKSFKMIRAEQDESWRESLRDGFKTYPDFENYMGVAIEIMEKLDNGATTDEIKEVLDNSGIEKFSKTFKKIRMSILLNSKKGPEFYEQTAYDDLSTVEKEYIEGVKQRNERYDKSVEQKIKRDKDVECYTEKTVGFLLPINQYVIKGWENNVEEFFKRYPDCGNHMDVAIEIMEKLENGATTGEIKELLKKSEIDETTESFNYIRNIFLMLTEKGPEFYEKTVYHELFPEEKEAIEDAKHLVEVVKRKNTKFDKSHEDNSTEEISEKRKIEEQEISDSFKEKENLKSEISDVEQKLTIHRDKKAELKKKSDQKQAENNKKEVK